MSSLTPDQSPLLPLEIIQHVVSFLDPATTDRQTLCSLLRVSSSCSEVAARRLYSTFTLDRALIIQLFWDVTDRKKKYFSYVHRLEITSIIDEGQFYSLSAAAGTDGTPLFPNARRLVFTARLATPIDTIPLPPAGTAIFDHLEHVCVQDHSSRVPLQMYLPSRRNPPLRSLTMHCTNLSQVFGTHEIWNKARATQLWSEWDVCRVFENPLYSSTLSFKLGATNIVIFEEHDYQDTWGPITVCLKASPKRAARFLDTLESYGWKQGSKIQLELDDNAPPCALCGE